MNFNVCSAIVTAIGTPLDSGLNALVQAFITNVSGWAVPAATLVVAWKAIEIAYGRGNIVHLWEMCARIAVILFLATHLDQYQKYVQQPLQGFGDELALKAGQALGNGNTGLNGNAFDAVLKDGMLQGLKVWQALGWKDIGPGLAVVAYWIAVIVFVACTFGLWFASTIMLKLLFAVGPVMIGLAMFNITRSYCFRWLDACAFRIALATLTAVFVQLLLAAEGILLAQYATTGAGAELIIGCLLGAALFVIAAKLTPELSDLAGQITGGAGSHGMSLMSAVTFGAAAAGARRLMERLKTQQTDA